MNNYEKIKGSTLYEMALCLQDLIRREPICRLCKYSTECMKEVPCYKMICQWLQQETKN